MNYIELLRDTARKAGNCACLGIDPNFGALPEGLDVRQFFLELFEAGCAGFRGFSWNTALHAPGWSIFLAAVREAARPVRLDFF